MKSLLIVSAAVALVASATTPTVATANEFQAAACSAKVLRGAYQFTASGFNIVNGVALPKAIIETLVFDGLGNVTTPQISLSVNGNIIQPPQGAAGTYTVEADCRGTLTFLDGVKFALQVRPYGRTINMLQANPGSVMQGTAERAFFHPLGN
jgi:hypothetical protein